MGRPDAADPVTVFDPFPPQLQGASFNWTCTAARPRTSCGAATGSTPPLRDTPVIAPSESVTYVLTRHRAGGDRGDDREQGQGDPAAWRDGPRVHARPRGQCQHRLDASRVAAAPHEARTPTGQRS